MLNHLISSFYLVVGLGMYGCGEIALDSQLKTHLLVLLVVKLSSIISDQHIGYPEAANYVSPDKTASLGLSNYGQRFCLNPLSKVIDSYDGVLQLHAS